MEFCGTGATGGGASTGDGARQEVCQEPAFMGSISTAAGIRCNGYPSGEDHYIQDADADMPYPDAAGGGASGDAMRLALRTSAAASPPLHIITGSSGDGGEAPPYGGLEDVPGIGPAAAVRSSICRGCRQVPAAASPSSARSYCEGGSHYATGRSQISPRPMPSPRRCFDLEQHLASVQAALPMSPNRSTAARAAVARAAGYGGMYGVLVPSGTAGEVLDEDDTVEDILDECISKGAFT